MNLKGLRVFVYVIEEGTLARASKKLHLSQPAASRLLSLLEGELATTLFYREKKRLISTPEGDMFYPEAVRILASIDGIPDFFQQIRKADTVPLRIICHARIVDALILPSITQLAHRRHNIRVKLEVPPRRDLGRRIAQEFYDIGIGALPIPAEDLEPRHLCSSPLQVLLPRDHALCSRPFLTTSELAQLPYIAFDKTTLLRRTVDQALLAEGARLDPHHEVSVGLAAYRLVLAGLGFTFVDPIGIEADLKQKLCLVPWSQAASMNYGVFLPKTVRRHHAIDDFVTCLYATVDKTLDLPLS